MFLPLCFFSSISSGSVSKRLPVSAQHAGNEQALHFPIHLAVIRVFTLQKMLRVSVLCSQAFAFLYDLQEQQLILRDGAVLIAEMKIKGLAGFFAAGEEIPARSSAFAEIPVSDSFQVRNAVFQGNVSIRADKNVNTASDRDYIFGLSKLEYIF